ncbi:hypothetical protein LTR95_017758, partial [Oleoguttula sp. CCFEE 5521]
MSRQEITQGQIRVAFGHNDSTGFYISVYDSRLEVNEEDGTVFDALRYAIAEDGTGAYVNAHTGLEGFGNHVT